MSKQQYPHFFNQATLQSQQKLVKGYYQQLIMMYGLDITYFRKNYEFFDPNGLLNTDGNVDWTYGYDSAYSFGNETTMRGYVELGNDAFIFSMIGADAEQDGKIFFTKEQFELDMIDAVGVMTSGQYSSTIDLEFENYTATYQDSTEMDAFEVTVAGEITMPVDSSPYDEIVPLTVTSIDTLVNEDISGDKAYVNNWLVQGGINGHLVGSLDEDGNGTLPMTNSGTLTYNEPAGDTPTNGWGIAPQVGDFIRLTFGDGTTEDYTFTQVTDRDLQNDGISPFLGKFVWKCQFTRKNYTHEDVPSGSIAREIHENDLLDQVINIQDTISDEIFDYDVDDPDVSDSVYGGF